MAKSRRKKVVRVQGHQKQVMTDNPSTNHDRDLDAEALQTIRETILVDKLARAIEERIARRFGRGAEGPVPVLEVGGLHPLGITEENVSGWFFHSEEYENIFRDLPFWRGDREKFASHIDAEELAHLQAFNRRVSEALARLRDQGRLMTKTFRDELYYYLPAPGFQRQRRVEWSSFNTVKGWAREYGVHRNTMTNMLKDGKIRFERVGRLVRIAVDDLPKRRSM